MVFPTTKLTGRTMIRLSILIAAILLAGCISTSSEPDIVATQLLPTPLPITPPDQFDVTAGAALFSENCAPCHGTSGMGDGPSAAGFTCPMPALAQRGADVVLEEWYKIAYNGKRSSETCLMPPWNRRLSAQQIWDVVAFAFSLKYAGVDSAAGESVLASLNAPPLDFTDTTWQAQTSDAEVLGLLTPDFGASLPPDDQQKLLAFVRSQVYREGVAVAAVQPPIATEEAAPIGTFIIDGTLVNGTAGAALPTDLTLTLRVVAINDAGEPEEVYIAETTADASGKFTFTEVPRQPRALAVVQTQYAGIRQFSDQIFPDAVTDEVQPLTLTIFETTTDDSQVRIEYVESLVDAVIAEGASLTYQTYEFVNTGDRAYIGENGRTLKLLLPPGAITPQVQAVIGGADRFEIVLEGDRYVVYDSEPLVPLGLSRITLAYGYAYDGQMSIRQQFAYPVDDLNVFVSATRGLRLESAQLTQGETATLNDITYQGFTLTADTLNVGEELSYTVKEGEPIRAAAAEETDEGGSFLRENTTLILGIGVLMVVAGGMFLIYDLQKTRLLAQQRRQTSSERDALIAQIAELDDAYDAGELDEDAYQRQRKNLKDKLLKLD